MTIKEEDLTKASKDLFQDILDITVGHLNANKIDAGIDGAFRILVSALCAMCSHALSATHIILKRDINKTMEEFIRSLKSSTNEIIEAHNIEEKQKKDFVNKLFKDFFDQKG